MLTSRYRRSEDVVIVPVIITQLELGNIQMQVLFADLVESADAAAFDQRPEALDRVGLNGTNNKFASAVIDGRVRIFLAKSSAA